MKLRIFAVLATIGAAAVAVLAGCSGKANPPPADDVPPGVSVPATPAPTPSFPHLAMPDACTLLTTDELAGVLGGPVEQRDKVPEAKGSCRWDGQHGYLQVEILDGVEDPHHSIDEERTYHETVGNSPHPVSGIGDGAILVTALDGTLIVAHDNLIFSFSYLGSVAAQAGKTDLIPEWRKVLTLAVSRAG